MQVFITIPSKNSQNTKEINHLCSLMKKSGFEDFCFVRDYPIFNDSKKMMKLAKQEIINSDLLLIDITKKSTGQIIEAGIAYAENKKIITVMQKGTKIKDTMRGISDLIIEYETIDDILTPLTNFYNQLNNN